MKKQLLLVGMTAAMAAIAQAEPDYSELPVALPDVAIPTITVPQPEIGKAHTPVIRAAQVASRPCTFYALPSTLDSDALPKDAAFVKGIGALPEGTANAGRLAQDSGIFMQLDAAKGGTLVEDIKAGAVNVADVAAVSVYSPEQRIAAWIDFRKKTAAMFKDQRMALHDTGLSPFSDSTREWLGIYREYGCVLIENVPLPSGISMIAEVRCPVDDAERSTLNANLAFYARQGYTSALLAIYGTESSRELRSVVADIKAAGMKVWFAFSGRESLRDTLFISPGEIDRCFSIVAAAAEGMLLGWRRTSAHLRP